ncbi:ATP-binding protein [Candidatus Woesearchaeota archaeon]|nr:MAG: ATP-binding protein [Candidatus Woesearchaeota archaeon]
MNVWYKELGFHNNPFSIKPAAFHDNLFGYEDLVARVIKSIEANKFVFIEGNYGEGKTTILKHVLRFFGGHKKVIYFSVNRVENRLQIRRLLNERYGRIGKWLDIRPKDMILLLDEVQDLDPRDVEKILKFKKEGNFRSVVFVSQKYDEKMFNKEVLKDLKHFKLEKLNENDAVKIVRKRIGDLEIISDDMIKKVFKLSNNNARMLLKNCEMLCKNAVDYGYSKVTDKIVNDFFGEVAEVKEEPKDEKIFLEFEEDEKKEVKEETEELETEQPEVKEETENSEELEKDNKEEVDGELEEEKPREELETKDVSVDEKLKLEKQEFEEHDKIDEELSRMELEENKEETVNKLENGAQKPIAAEEALAKDTEEILDKHYY